MNSLPEKTSRGRAAAATALRRAGDWWEHNDRLLYAWFAAICTVYVAATFYGYMHVQTRGVWSAPLDDVFIHFDYARSFARGYPFQWSEGNGYSSGNTSLTYPLVLGVGYWVGFRDLALMRFAAVVAVVSVLGFLLLAARWLGPGHPGGHRFVKYLLPPAVLSVGALDWTLFSGMENAFHLLVWGAFMAAAYTLLQAQDRRRTMRRQWATGLLGALLVATRPESAICVAVVGIYCALAPRQIDPRSWPRRLASRTGLSTMLAIGLPGAALLLLVALLNLWLTGEHQANGAIAKLFWNNPYMSATDMWERYVWLLTWIIPRLTEHHFASARLAEGQPWGYILPLLGIVPLLLRRTRPVAIMLWAQILGWLLLVSLNNQLRWHNARYAMPAVTWLLILAVMGLGVVVSAGAYKRRSRLAAAGSWAFRLAAATTIAGVYWHHQQPRFRDQVWFFGRASRNILDQHVAAGRLLKRLKVRRVLVGDAGALIYASDRPGLDLIGLGGYRALPFARATVHGLGASLELVERMAPAERPDIMAIYPSWWADLATYFGRYITAFPVVGNVICGGAEKVLFETDWSAMDRRGTPRTLADGERVVDELDVADLISERTHDYRCDGGRPGFVRFRVLDDSTSPLRDLFDAGRGIAPGQVERATMKAPQGRGRLILRVAPAHSTAVAVSADGQSLGELRLADPVKGWREVSLPLPSGLGPSFELALSPVDGESVHYHVWVVEKLGHRE